jgi:predicted transcriptional regulator
MGMAKGRELNFTLPVMVLLGVVERENNAQKRAHVRVVYFIVRLPFR